jgi:hypothetical protein
MLPRFLEVVVVSNPTIKSMRARSAKFVSAQNQGCIFLSVVFCYLMVGALSSSFLLMNSPRNKKARAQRTARFWFDHKLTQFLGVFFLLSFVVLFSIPSCRQTQKEFSRAARYNCLSTKSTRQAQIRPWSTNKPAKHKYITKTCSRAARSKILSTKSRPPRTQCASKESV